MMNYKNKTRTILLVLFAFAALAACTDDDIQIDESGIPTDITSGYSLTLAVSLEDGIGGTGDNPMREIENYVDPEKLRVLFFDNEDQFLFESKSRWVKQLPQDGNLSRWFVSVPVFSYGNDTGEYEWNWTEIRKALTTNNFKIAILANRPDIEWNMGILGRTWVPKDSENPDEGDWVDNSNIKLVKSGWFDNSGPNWTKENAIGGTDKKELFDLHHCQYDPIYDGKNWDNYPYDEDGKPAKEGVTADNYLEFYQSYNIYDFISQTFYDNDGVIRPRMGATSSWVSWGTNDDDKKKVGGRDMRYWIHPSEKHPIPMYGIQEFEPLKDWKEGTTYNLTGENTIFLLRSVVKAELILPANITPDFIVLWYPNIYARCEPLDIWTPTEKIWSDSHEDCEWKAIQNYGPVTNTTDIELGELSRNAYKKRMSWFYGLWENHDWPYGSLENEIVSEAEGGKYPKILNTCIQRNTYVACADNIKYPNGDYNHWIVYMGERNVNDPTNLSNIGDDSPGSPTIIYWMVSINGISYGIPFVDYNEGKSADAIIVTNTPSTISNIMNPYEKEVQQHYSECAKPLPLLRNHHYKFTLDGFNTWDFSKGFSMRTNTNLKTNVDNWEYESSSSYTGYKNKTTSVFNFDKKAVMANSQIIKELVGITFENNSAITANCIGLRSNGLNLAKADIEFSLPKLETGDKVKILYVSASSSEKRGLTSINTNVTLTDGEEDVSNTNTTPTIWTANASTTPKFKVKKPIRIIEIQIIKAGEETYATNRVSRRAGKNGGGITVKSENLYSKSLTGN